MYPLFFFILIFAWHRVLGRALRADETFAPGERWAAALTFQAVFWTALSFALGFAGHFRLNSLIDFGAAFLALAWFGTLFLNRPSETEKRPIGNRIRQWVDQFDTFAWLFLLIALPTALFFLWLGVSAPVLSYDGLSYHLGTAVHMAQDGDLRWYPGESLYTNFFARGTELFMAVSIMLSGSTVWVNAVQWLIFPVLIPAVYSATRALGASPPRALIAAMIPLTVPIILMQSAIAYADLFANGWFAVGFCAVLGSAGGKAGPARILWMFAAAGLALAAKFNAAILCVLLGLAALMLWGPRRMLMPRRGLLVYTALGLLLAAAAGLPWMLRNWTQFGSPIYPFAVEIGPLTLAEAPNPMEGARQMGEMQYYQAPFFEKLWMAWSAVDFESWRRIGFLGAGMEELPREDLYDYTFGYRGDAMESGFGLAWPAVLFPAMIAVLLMAALRKRWQIAPGDPVRRLYLAALAAVPLIAPMILIAGWVPRFSLFLPVFGAVALAVLAEEISYSMRWVSRLILSAALLCCAFDAATVTLLNRDAERLSRYSAANPAAPGSPIDYFAWLNPGQPDVAAADFLMSQARPGETVSFWTPNEGLFTGYFVDEGASIRLFLFPSVFPDPFAYSHEELLGFIEEEDIALLLVSDQVPESFIDLIEGQGSEEIYNRAGYRVFEFPAHRR